MKITDKDKNFLMRYLNLNEPDLQKLFDHLKSLPEDGDHNREEYVAELCNNLPGRDAYEIKKILLHRLFE
ncbi:MAG: hypothetical protein PHW04_07685 [Candidatus Wallbacteria bacterium]|nr:hypothetical protein [Candidatus Wallbacteria bacterium]